MSNCFYDETLQRTRCGEYAGELARHVSSNGRVSCPDCRDQLTPDEREGQWYPFVDDQESAK